MPIYSPGVKPRDMHEHLHSSIGVGPKGDDGERGDQGDPGFSPTVSTGDHVITITDINGPHVYELPTYADEEAARAAAETARQQAEQARQTAETVRRNNETNREFRERQRDDAEGTRQASENVREYREGRRQSFESIRRSDETTRQSNETARRQAEQARVNAEQQRVAADEARDQAEAQRAADWEQIKVEVDARGTAEAARQQAEQERANNEVARQQAEAARNSAEQARRQAESSRDSAEQVRMQHEQDRSRAENARNIAESARSNAELERNSSWQTMSENVDAAIAAANDAASDIREAAERGDFDGAPGETGPAGPAGSDGFSPTVDVQAITGGHEVTITDADGAHSFDVMDGDPSTPGSITDAMLAPDGIKAQVAQLWGNQLTGTMSGTIDTAADAFAAPPMALTVEGASTQAGTPTPDAPVAIKSVDELTVHASPSNVLVWNQLARVDGVFLNTNYWSATGAASSTGTEHTITATSNGQVFGCNYARSLSIYPIVNHKYYIALDAKGDVPLTVCLYTGSITIDRAISGVNLTSNYVRYSGIATCAHSVGMGLRMAAYPNTSVVTGNYFTFKNMQFIDLTLMYGAGNEPTTVAEVQADLPEDFYEFDQGTPNDYTNWPVSSLLHEGTSLRSLPDGTKDTLNLSYLRPSTREGWAWYSREVVAKTHLVTFDGSENWVRLDNQYSTGKYFAISTDRTNPLIKGTIAVDAGTQRWTHYVTGNPYSSSSEVAWMFSNTDWTYNTIRTARPSGIETVEEYKAWLADNPVTVVYELRTPVTTQLDPIELPELPAPDCTVWCDGGSAQPTYTMQYVQDTNIVIADLRAALADLATS